MHWDGSEEITYVDDDSLNWESEKIKFVSVGIDIGSSTSHLMFSELVLRRRGKEFFGGFVVANREIIYQSPILLTPYLNDHTTIDIERLWDFIQENYRKAGFSVGDIDTGAVITTGEAAKKENARRIIELFAEDSGKFVTATAGPNLEATLAAFGSGAAKVSSSHEKSRTIMNVDIGGGTTKVAVVQNGRILDTAAFNIGSRLVAVDMAGKIDRIEQAGYKIAKSIGIELRKGEFLETTKREALAAKFTELLQQFVLQEQSQELDELLITEPLKQKYNIDCFIFSGGVSEYLYGYEQGNFGDLGDLLGKYLRNWLDRDKIHYHKPLQYIRATVIGASQYTVQVSGNTIYLQNDRILPLRNLPVIQTVVQNSEDVESIKVNIAQGFKVQDLIEGENQVALAFSWKLEPSYQNLAAFAQGLMEAVPRTIEQRLPLVVILDADVAGLVGHILREFIPEDQSLIVVDQISLRELNFVDLGKEIVESKAVPVTVKSLIFR